MKIYNSVNTLYLKNSELQKNLELQQEKGPISFSQFIWEKIKQVDRSQKQAHSLITALAKGEEVDFGELAILMQKADIDLKLLLRIRNKIIEAYQEIMRMQI